MEKIDKKLLEKMNIKTLDTLSSEDVDFLKTIEINNKNILFLKNSQSICIYNAYESFVYELKRKEKLENIFLIDNKIFQEIYNEIEEFKNSSITLSNLENADEIALTERGDLDDTKVSKILQNILNSAIKLGVSDVHILPKSKDLLIKFRKDGDMMIHEKYPKGYSGFIVNKLKSLGKMDITNSMIPQDGKIKTNLNNKTVELRVSTCPTIYGEDAILRIQQREDLFNLKLDDLGFREEELEKYRNNFAKPYGLILNVGATGAGKSTTFYLTIDELSKMYQGKNIVTVEDPVEIKYENITQIEVDDKRGRSYASVLKSLLRQDPDIILIGEIRDEITGGIAVKASLTGHLVLATLHANDSFNAITRLRDLKISDPLIGATSNCFLSQRLLKKLCQKCKKKIELSEDVEFKYDLKSKVAYEANKEGCEHCDKGYKGRIAIIELLEIDDKLREFISSGISETELKIFMKKRNFQNLWKIATQRLEEGLIDMVELTGKVNQDPILNKKEKNISFDNRFIIYPEQEIEVRIKNNYGNVFDISKQGISFIFDEIYLMEIDKEVKINIEGEDIIFTPKSYGKYQKMFIVGGTYKGDLSFLIE